MNPQTPANQKPPAPQPASPAPSAPSPPATSSKVPFYRSYWIFAAIYLLLTPIIGLIILFTGEVYRKDKQGQFHPISKKEKTTLTVVAFVLWALLILEHK